MVARLQYLRFCLFEMYANVGFVIRCLYVSEFNSEQHFIRIIIIIILAVIGMPGVFGRISALQSLSLFWCNLLI